MVFQSADKKKTKITKITDIAMKVTFSILSLFTKRESVEMYKRIDENVYTQWESSVYYEPK